MIGPVSELDADRIRAAAGCEALHVRTVDEIGSTNESLMLPAFGERPAAPTLLAAAHQSAGRGRRGREWVAERGRSLAFSIAFERLVRGEPPPTALSIAVGAATATALTPWARDLRLKWPNDLQRDGRKLGGILVETRRSLPSSTDAGRAIERIVVGIGVNLAAPRAALANPACGLFDGAVALDHAETVIGCIAGAVVRGVEQFFVEGLGGFVETWRRFDALCGEAVVVLDGDRVVLAGRALGIDACGGLRLHTERGIHVLRGGEVSVRRRLPERQGVAR